MKVPRYSGVNTKSLWEGSGTYHPDVALAPVLSSTSYAYKSAAANDYNTNSIKEVRFSRWKFSIRRSYHIGETGRVSPFFLCLPQAPSLKVELRNIYRY